MELAPLPAEPTGRAAGLDPRWKLAAIGLALLALLLVRTLPAALAGLLGCVVLLVWAGLPAAWLRTRLALVLPTLALFALPLPFLIRDDGPLYSWGLLTVSSGARPARSSSPARRWVQSC